MKVSNWIIVDKKNKVLFFVSNGIVNHEILAKEKCKAIEVTTQTILDIRKNK